MEDTQMLAPSLSSTRMAEAHRAEHTGHRIHQIQQDRLDPTAAVPTLTHRLMTVRRLAADRLADLGHAARAAAHHASHATGSHSTAAKAR
jgi:hypothetical protein